MNHPDYHINAGSLNGEISNEVYSKYGEQTYNNSQFGWHHEYIDQTTTKIYNLVNTPEGVKFLIATATYELVDKRVINYKTKKRIGLVPIMLPDFTNPIRLDLEWRDANIPFISKQEADNLNLSYNL